MTKRSDTAYLAVSAQIRAMEAGLLTREQLSEGLESRSMEELLRLAQEHGYPGLTSPDPAVLDGAIREARAAMEESLRDMLPDRRLLELDTLKYDYHNVKTLLKARLAGVDAGRICVDLGRIPPQELGQRLEAGEFDLLPGMLGPAAAEAKEILDTTRDGQLMDIALDHWYYRELLDLAKALESGFLLGYVRRQIDTANLRALVRTLRMGKGPDFLRGVLLPGGEMGEDELLFVSQNGGLGALYAATPLAAAAEQGEAALQGGPLTEFERLCDDAESDYLEDARFVPFGEQVVIAYLSARETEFKNLRIALLGRSMDLPVEVIRARLRK